MAQKPPVHVELREEGWAVVREGEKRATSAHPTQSQAAEEGRDLARREQAEFFLHAQDGHVREHRSYGEELNDTEEAHGLTDARHDEGFGAPEERYAGYEVYSQDGERLGKPDDLFVDENDNPEYVGVRIDPSGTTSALIPAEVVTVDDNSRRMMVSRSSGVVEAGPGLGHGEELTPTLEERVRAHYRLAASREIEDRSGYDAYYRDDADLAVAERGASAAEDPSVLEGADERRVRRSEEELRVGTRERETGAVRVRKRVHTDRERIVVPKKRVEVTVERVPVEGEAAGSEIRDDEIVVPITEEEIVVEKRPVVKEEIRIRKEVVEEAEVVEEDVRREEVDVDDETKRRDA